MHSSLAFPPRTLPAYTVRLAAHPRDVLAAQRLRFEVFNLELNEGLATSHALERDEDEFDAVCDHLIVTWGNAVVGTYRMQTGPSAGARLGYYSAQEFDFTPFASIRPQLVELGRACVRRDHRNMNVLGLLWRGIAAYARAQGGRYLIGCSSLTSQDPGLGRAMFRRLSDSLADAPFRTVPLPDYALPEAQVPDGCPAPPKLLRTYLSLGARICGPPAIDRVFGTIDFLTLIDLNRMTAASRSHFFGPA